MANLKVGIAAVDYTPKNGLPLMGNFRNDYGARGVHDPLYAKAVVFENSTGGKVALLSVDICMIERKWVGLMREAIYQDTGIPKENILIAATHTHSGPAPMGLGSLPKADDTDIEQFLKKAATAVGLANRNSQESKISVGYSSEDRLSFNRRLACKDGQTHMNWEKLDPNFVLTTLGPIDPQVIAVSVQQGQTNKAALVNFGLHPAILAGDNWLYSADYPGYLAEALQRIYGTDFTTVFLNGCCGNVNHIDYQDPLQGRGYKMTQRCGYMLATAVQEAMCRSTAVEGDHIAVSRELVTLKRLKISDKDRQWSETVLEKAKKQATAGQVDGLPDEFYAHTWMDVYKKQNTDDNVEVMAIRIGNLAIVGLPGEIFCEFGMEIKKHSPAKHTLVIELANDAVGYIPTQNAFAEGGYEPSTGSTMYEKGSGEKMTESALNQLKKLF
ncbi:MAG: neutral/alkaline non-lysosomal ceramidase N-terminal domain-containing protein [Phycisphaerae bacterium]